MDSVKLRGAIRSAICELAREKGQPENVELSELIVDSLDRMRIIVAIETNLGVAVDDDKIMNLDVTSEDNILKELHNLVQI